MKGDTDMTAILSDIATWWPAYIAGAVIGQGIVAALASRIEG